MTVVAAHQNNNNKENNKNDIQTQKKKVMEASELLSKHARGRGIRALTSDDEMTSGRKNSTVMKYSSISPSESSRSRPRLPSAKTITRQCFPVETSSSSTTSSPDSLLVDSYNKYEEEAYVLDGSIASPTSRQIMQEVSKIYEASPVPRSYLESPHKKSPIISSGKKKISLHHSAGKIELEASDLLAKQQQKSRRRPPNNKGFATTNNNKGKDVKSSTSNNKKKPVPLAVQREKQQRKERLKEAKNAPKHEVDGRRNLDKRTARLRYGEAFASHTLQYRQQYTYLNNGTNHSDKVDNEIQSRSQNGVSIVVRKRPVFDYELERGDYDIVSIDNTMRPSNDVIIVHNAIMHADMKRMMMKHIRYPVTAAFDEHCSDDDTYKHIAKPLVLDAVMNGGVSTILMFGQTGAGKSFTMTGIETRTAHSIFQALDTSESQPVVTIQFVELCGSKEIRDLLVKKSGDVKLAEDKDGSVRILNAASCEVTSPEELLSRILVAKGRRATEATDKNGVSSRSHAVCQISITSSSSKRGLLTLIDCAGSERRHDSMYHSSERQKESSEINASLYSLKECIRARANNSSVVPFRSSSLTRILKESFVRDGARLCVIACVAPNATDTNHTMETLKTVASIVGVDDQIKESSACTVEPPTLKTATRTAVLAPKQWTHERLRKFLAHKKVNGVQLTEKHDGKALMKMSVMNIKTHLLPDRDEDKARLIFDLLRKENDRVAAHNKIERDRIKRDRKLAAAHRG